MMFEINMLSRSADNAQTLIPTLTHQSFCIVFDSVPSTPILSRYLYQLVVLNYIRKDI
ncbi:hypothetical protein HanRHA438_Chr01g0040301 [Helianthus annuus]|nr:hypothetical protein HanRHA438_Chr01g0040301 [Helianthus annuus]